MAWPSDCPPFEYTSHQDYPHSLRESTRILLADLRASLIDTAQAAADSRPVHGRLFSNLVPPAHGYYAGHYRGEPFRCLLEYEVGILDDPRVGSPPWAVLSLMRELSKTIGDGLAALDREHQRPQDQISREEKLYSTVALACNVFEHFLRIHPFANGNGHTARFVIWAILGRFGYWPVRWPVEPRPPNPPYVDLIRAYRNGNRVPLERHILGCLCL